MVVPEASRDFEIPEGVSLDLIGRTLTVNGPKGSLTREFPDKDVAIDISDDTLTIKTHFPAKKKVALLGMYGGRIRNMLRGVTTGFRARLKIVSSHFPITLEVRDEQVLINNFLGERHPRKARIHEGAEVSVEGEFVSVVGIDKDAVAQTAANIEQGTVIRGRDRRIFQDGIYLVEKTHLMEEL